MKTAITQLEALGFKVSLSSDDVRIEKTPQAKASDEVHGLLLELKEHKQGAIRFLMDRSFDEAIQAAIFEFDKAGITVHNTSEEAMETARTAEERLTACANAHDEAGFLDALSAWKSAWKEGSDGTE